MIVLGGEPDSTAAIDTRGRFAPDGAFGRSVRGRHANDLLTTLTELARPEKVTPEVVLQSEVTGHMPRAVTRPAAEMRYQRRDEGRAAPAGLPQWAILDSNQGPPPYQSGALTD